MKTSLDGKRILIGVSGGIAIYKTVSLISLLKKAGAEVEVVMTQGAREFVGALTFQTMSGRRVFTELFDEQEGFIPHIDLTRRNDVFLIAPATANILAKMANGIADDLLSATALAAHCPVLVSPAMNVYMYKNEATQANIRTLRERGIGIVEPESGWLACNEVGEGRMPEAQDLFEILDDFFTEKDLAGKRIAVTGGGTRERLDPVRFLTNDSSGKQGLAIARRAMKRGADVVFVHGDVRVQIPQKMNHVAVESTEDMLNALKEIFDSCDALIMAAAPCDYRPSVSLGHKRKKESEDEVLTMEFLATPDILKSLAPLKTKQTVIGFAAETDDVKANAKKKLESKKLDYIVCNDVTAPGAGFNGDTNIASILSADKTVDLPMMSKEDLADRILDLLA